MSGRKRVALEVAVILVVLGVAGLLVAASGIIPIKASSGHWAITVWFLQFSKGRSVATHTLGAEVPPLERRSLVVRGAAHYEIGCRGCHGSPELRTPRVAQRMLPAPPYLPDTLSRWDPAELHYMVKHGIKLTGMPAWPSPHRDDEVWAMVAFLLQLPKLDAAGYRRLASVEPAGRRDTTITTRCDPCHGVDGRGGGTGAFPDLAGQRPAYLFASLEAYARGQRHSGTMEPIAADLSPETMRALADHYGRLSSAPPVAPASAAPPAPPASPAPPSDASAAIARGEAIARQGVPARDVPACVACHGPGATPLNPAYPQLAGQYAEYLALQLKLFKQQRRGGTAYAHLMCPVAAGLTEDQMNDVARYYASLPSPAR